MGRGKIKVFISYARENADVARRLYNDLKSDLLEPWLDTECILPGQRWSDAIGKAIKNSDYFLALFSSTLVSKRGYVQKEIKDALAVLEDVPPDKGYLIPIRLDDCNIVIDQFKDYQWVDLFPAYEDGLAKLLRAILPQTSVIVGDASDPSQAGWGVIFGAAADPKIYDELAPLLEWRRQQTEHERPGLYKEFTGPAGYRQRETHLDFLSRNGVGPSYRDPLRVPMYLLIVGDPEEIPFEFQYGLSTQYYVGRIHFESHEDYRRYANSILNIEKKQPRQPPLVSFFSPRHIGDGATNLSTIHLIRPLREALAKRYPALEIRSAEGEEATKIKLLSLLSNLDRPQLLFIAAHGMMFSPDGPLQETAQGSILCMDWSGFGRVDASHYVSPSDLLDVKLDGMIIFIFGDFGGGTPTIDEFYLNILDLRANAPLPRLAPRSFVSSLAKQLLGKCGASAILAHIDRAWGYSIQWKADVPQIDAFRQALSVLADGETIGKAHNFFVQRFIEFSSHTSIALSSGLKADDSYVVSLNLATVDARNFVVIGDPAVRMTIRGHDGA